MKRIILVSWDDRIGPRMVKQYPPEMPVPSKDTLLDIWAKHETKEDKRFVELLDENNKYLSYINRESDAIYFIVVELENIDQISICREILIMTNGDIVKNLKTEKIQAILKEIYDQIQNYSLLDEQALFRTTFQDEKKCFVFQILQDGVLSKHQLEEELIARHNLRLANLEVLLTPFLRLNLITSEKMPGIGEHLFLIEDVALVHFPPNLKKLKIPNSLLKIYRRFYTHSVPKIPEENIAAVCQLLLKPPVQDLMKELGRNALEKPQALEFLNGNTKAFKQLVEHEIILETEEDQIYLFSTPLFLRFTPLSLVGKLIQRINKGALSFDQLTRQLALILR